MNISYTLRQMRSAETCCSLSSSRQYRLLIFSNNTLSDYKLFLAFQETRDKTEPGSLSRSLQVTRRRETLGARLLSWTVYYLQFNCVDAQVNYQT